MAASSCFAINFSWAKQAMQTLIMQVIVEIIPRARWDMSCLLEILCFHIYEYEPRFFPPAMQMGHSHLGQGMDWGM